MKRRALVTGASRGIGQAIATEFQNRGWEVLEPSRSALDLSQSAAILDYRSVIEGKKLDALVHAAGVNFPRSLGEISEENWSEIMQVNLTALRQLIQVATPVMIRGGGGRILALSSIFSMVTRPGRAVYTASKAAVDGLIRAVAVELGGQGILANSLCPGYIDTDLTRQNNTPDQIARLESCIPLGRLGRPEEMARLAVWLCSEENTYLTGQAIVADGGFTCQ